MYAYPSVLHNSVSVMNNCNKTLTSCYALVEVCACAATCWWKCVIARTSHLCPAYRQPSCVRCPHSDCCFKIGFLDYQLPHCDSAKLITEYSQLSEGEKKMSTLHKRLHAGRLVFHWYFFADLIHPHSSSKVQAVDFFFMAFSMAYRTPKSPFSVMFVVKLTGGVACWRSQKLLWMTWIVLNDMYIWCWKHCHLPSVMWAWSICTSNGDFPLR